MNADRPSKASTDNRLYVEGADDFHVICALARRSGVQWTSSNRAIPFAPHTNGDKSALDQAAVAVKTRLPRVGLVIDADSNPQQRWEEIRRKFGTNGVELPDSYPATGLVLPIGSQRLGIWMMPHGGDVGAIETFLDTMIPDSSLKQHANEATAKARNCGATFADKDLAKARVRTWLAWQAAPGAPYGRAIDLAYFSAASSWADQLVNWFRSVFLTDD